MGFEPISSDSQSEVLARTRISQAKSCPIARRAIRSPLRGDISHFVRDHGTLPHLVRAIPWLLYDSHSDPSGTWTRHFRLERPANWPFILWDQKMTDAGFEPGIWRLRVSYPNHLDESAKLFYQHHFSFPIICSHASMLSTPGESRTHRPRSLNPMHIPILLRGLSVRKRTRTSTGLPTAFLVQLLYLFGYTHIVPVEGLGPSSRSHGF